MTFYFHELFNTISLGKRILNFWAPSFSPQIRLSRMFLSVVWVNLHHDPTIRSWDFHDLVPVTVTVFQRSCSRHHGIRPKIKSVQMFMSEFFKTQSFVRFVIKSDNLHLEQKSNNDQIRALANPDQDLPMSLFGVCVQDFFKFSLFVNNALKNK